MRVLRERYLLREDGDVVETPDGMCRRVARAVAQAEARWPDSGCTVAEMAGLFYELMAGKKFMPNSPTLMNAGKNNDQQLSACFVLPVADSMEGIFDSVKHAAIIHKSGGGTGFSFSRLRPAGSTVSTTDGAASGPVSFMRVFNGATEAVKQGGTRRGANMGILRIDHPDILEFIDCKLDGGITNFNISVAATDEFMHALANDSSYDLIEPHTGRTVGSLDANKVFDLIVAAAWSTGDPGMVFIDRINNSPANPTPEVGMVEATNPCGEQPLLPYEACNLGSINLARFVDVERGDFNWDELEKDVRTCVRFLDDVIEVNPYPLPEIHKMVKANRRIGLGVMGWADALFMLGMPYDGEEALALGARTMELITRIGHEESQQLARERGPFPNWSRSIYKDDKPLRNSTITTIAPTGTISIIADCSSGIEPIFALAFTHRANDRELRFVNPIFEKAAKDGGFYSKKLMDAVQGKGSLHDLEGVPDESKRVFVTAHEITPPWHVRMQAAFQHHTDNAVSKTINLPNNATAEDVAKAYLDAYGLGCLGITVFRDGSKGVQVLNVGVEEGKSKERGEASAETPSNLHYEEASSVETIAPVPAIEPDVTTDERRPTSNPGFDAMLKPRPAVVHGYTRNIRAPEGTVNITVNSDDDGLVEVFVNVGKAGSDIAALAEALGRLTSMLLRMPSPMGQVERTREIIGQLRGIGGSRSVGFGARQVRSLPDAVALALEMHIGLGDQHHVRANGNGDSAGKTDAETIVEQVVPIGRVTGNLCPDCKSNTLVYQEGCRKCQACGFSEC